MTDDKIEYRRPEDIPPHPENPKTHDVEAIAASLQRFGFIEPIVVDRRTGLNVSGHGRVEALMLLRDREELIPEGCGDNYAAPVFTDWGSVDDDEARAALVALNRLTEVGGWDDRALTGLLEGLSEAGRLDDAIGYGDRELEQLTKRLEKTEADRPQKTFSLELMERQDYVVLVFTNEMDWHTAQEKLGLGTVYGPDSTDTSPRAGLGRVVDGATVIEAMPPEGIDNPYRDRAAEAAPNG